MKKSALFFTLLIISAFAYAQDTSIDSTFGVNGIVVTSLANKHLHAKDILMQPEDKILLCGDITSVTGVDMLLIRYKNNGVIDSSYGINGLITFDFFTKYETALSMKGLSSGDILIGGYGKDSTGNYLVICKVDSQGKLDSTFGNNGKCILAGIDSIITIDLQSSGAIIAATQNTMFRLTPAGLLDIGFGTNGFVLQSAVSDMVVQADNKIVLTGGFGAVTKRFLANGDVDIGFASAGTYENFDTTLCVEILGVQRYERKVIISSVVTLDSAGGIYVGGIERYDCRPYASSNPSIFKLTSAGRLDSAFKPWNRNFFSSSFYSEAFEGINIQSNNRQLALSIEAWPGNYDVFRINRILPNGDNDSGFVVKNIFGGSSNFGGSNQDIVSNAGAALQYDSALIVVSSVDYSLLTQGIKIPHIKLCRYISSVSHNLPRPDFYISKTFGDTNTEFVPVSITPNGIRLEWSFYPNHVEYKSSSSSSNAPRVRFKYPGKYTVRLVAINQHGSDSIIKADFINIGHIPVASFSTERVLADTNNTLQLLDSSLNNPNMWEWEISPGSFSYVSGSDKNSQHPVVRFHIFGTYSVKLKVSNAFGKDSLLKTSYITVSSPFTQARFASNLETADTSDIIQLSDQSISTSSLTYQWGITPDYAMFMNGTNKQSKNPAVKLTVPGIYSVKLTISNTYGSDSLFKQDYLKIGLKPVTRFYENIRTGDTSQVFSFIDSSYNNPSSRNWKFNTSEMFYVSGDQLSKNIDVKFKKNGLYSIQLRVCNSFGCDSLLKADLINVSTPTGITGLLANENGLKIVPNPCSSFVKFLTPQEKINSISLIDLQGQNCYWKNGVDSEVFEVDLWSKRIKPGIYFVIITTNNGIYRQKMLVLSDL